MRTLFPNISLSLSLISLPLAGRLGLLRALRPGSASAGATSRCPWSRTNALSDTLSVQPRHASVRAINFNAKDLASAQASAEDEEPTLRFDTGFE